MRHCPAGIQFGHDLLKKACRLTSFLFIYSFRFKSRGRYVNHIVVQHSPLIMQDSDSSVRVECAFEASEQTITYNSMGNRRDGSDNVGPGSIDVT